MSRDLPARSYASMPARLRPSADMNITPMIDVLLVLLVIFMAALPLSQRGLDAQLPPETDNQQQAPARPSQDIVLEYFADRRLELNSQPVGLHDLQQRLTDVYRDRRNKTLYIMGAGALRYGDIVAVIDAGKGAGVERVGIITEAMRRGVPSQSRP